MLTSLVTLQSQSRSNEAYLGHLLQDLQLMYAVKLDLFSTCLDLQDRAVDLL